MYCITKLCRICVAKEENMKSIYSLDTDQVSFYKKLLICVPELKSEKILKELFLCSSCCSNITNLYTFRNNCVKNKSLFEGYVQQLNQGNNQIKPGDLVINLSDTQSNSIPPNRHTMTYNKDINKFQENFYFNMSTDEFRLENCTQVCASPMNDVDFGRNIQDLSQSTSFFNSNIFDNVDHLDNNTDGEITKMIESFCDELPNDEPDNSDVISLDKTESQNNYENDLETIQELNDQTSNIIIANTNNISQIHYVNGDCNKIRGFENTDIKILDSSSCNFQILNLIQNSDVQFLINSNDLPQIIPNTINGTSVINISPIERVEPSNNIKIEAPQKTQVIMKKTKMSPEEIEQNVAKKVKTIMESIANSQESNKKIDVITKPGQAVEVPEKKNEPIKCELCKNMYKDQASLRKHKYIVHEAQASFKCDFCGKAFKTSYRCRYHMKLHLTNQKGPNLCKCEFCGEVFANIISFESHAKTHNEHVSLLCVLCEEKFAKTQDFENHIKSHLGSAMYKCQSCEMEFEKFNDMRSHQRIHTGQQLFICQYCNKNYCNRTSLNRHIIKTHDNYDPSLLVPKK